MPLGLFEYPKIHAKSFEVLLQDIKDNVKYKDKQSSGRYLNNRDKQGRALERDIVQIHQPKLKELYPDDSKIEEQ